MLYRKTRHYKITTKPKAKLSLKSTLLISSGIGFLLIIISTLFFNFSNEPELFAASTGDYRSAASGNWNVISTWQRYNGSGWVTASATPTNADGTITIRTGHTVTNTSGVNVDQVTIETGAQLDHTNGTFKVVNGTGTDLTVNGIFNITASVTIDNSSSASVYGLVTKNSGGGLSFNSGGTLTIENGGIFRKYGGSQDNAAGHWIVKSGGMYDHADNGTNLPNADWQTGSTCLITGMTTYDPSNLDQAFYNLTWNCPNQTMTRNLSSALQTINGDLTIISTGTGGIKLNSGSNQSLTIAGNYYHQGGTLYETGGGDWITNVTGNFVQTGGSFVMTNATTSSGNGSPTLNVSGNFTISGGTFDMSQYTGTNINYGTGTLNLYGDLTFSGGTITETAVSVGKGVINFTKSGTQIVTGDGTISNTIDFNVYSGSTVNLGTAVLTGNGYFYMNNNSGLVLGSPSGISISGATGNVQVTGTRTYNSLSSYTYAGSSEQVTGNGLPSVINNLTINNSSGVTLTSSSNAALSITFSSGNVTTNANTLSLGSSTASTGTLTRTSGHVIGNFKRWIAASAVSNILFPLGTNATYNGMNLSFTSAPSTGGTLTSSFISSNPGDNGLPLNDAGFSITNAGAFGYWQCIPANGITGGIYTLDLYGSGFTTVNDYTLLRIVYRNDAASNWVLNGTHSAGTGTNPNPIAHRTAMTGFAQFGLGGNTVNPLPVELVFFKATSADHVVKTSWKTASEVNNNYFTIERSADGTDFIAIGKEKGSGNSSSTHEYSFTDNDPLRGKSYYRLRQTDFNGKSAVSMAQAVSNNDKQENSDNISILKTVPNPFDNYFHIDYSIENDGEVIFMLSNASGQIVNSSKLTVEKGNHTFEFNEGASLKPGIYFFKMISGEKQVLQKLIKK